MQIPYMKAEILGLAQEDQFDSFHPPEFKT